MRKYYAVLFIAVLAISMVLLLVFVNGCLWGKLQTRTDQKTLDDISKVYPGASYYTLKSNLYTVYDDRRDKIGYAFYAEGDGKEGKIEIIVGLEDKETIAGIAVLSSHERFNRGEAISVPLDFSSLASQFAGLKIDSCYLKKDNGQVNGITGATISSRAVVEAVRQAALEEARYIG